MARRETRRLLLLTLVREEGVRLPRVTLVPKRKRIRAHRDFVIGLVREGRAVGLLSARNISQAFEHDPERVRRRRRLRVDVACFLELLLRRLKIAAQPSLPPLLVAAERGTRKARSPRAVHDP